MPSVEKQKKLDETYHTLIQVCLYDRPLQDMEPYLAEDVMNFGAGKHELTTSKKSFIDQIANQKKLAEGLKMEFQFTPVLRKITNEGLGAIYTDDILNTVWVNGAKNELKFRLSFIFEYKGGQWWMIHSHTSAPDVQRTDVEVWPVEELKKRTEYLEKTLEEKIIELEEKNRELEIESALEKVRSRTMAMHAADELGDVVVVIVEKLKELGVILDANGVVLCTYFRESKDVLHWIVSPDYKIAGKYLLPFFDHPIFNAAWESRISGAEYFSKAFSVEEKNSFYEYAFEHSDYKQFPEDFKEWVFHNDKHSLSFAWQKNSAILIPSHTGVIPSEEDIAVLKRFAKVFEQSYVRFLDLQKAETQAREAQIEAALERVRAASMAMHRANELAQVVNVLFQQFSQLELDFYQVWINIFLLEEGISQCWFSPVEGAIKEAYTAVVPLGPFEDSPIKSWRAGEEFSNLSYRGRKEVNEIMKALSEMTGHPSFRRIQRKKKMDRVEIVDCNHKYGVLAMAKNDDIAEEDRAILKRFTKVFEQTYTRFLDLLKAEAQAREGRIELSLERIRAQAMAMNKSADLLDIVVTMRKEFVSLGHEAHYFWHMRWLADKYEKAMTSGDGTRIGMIMDLPRHMHGDIELLAEWENSDDPIVVHAMDAEAAIAYIDKMIALGDFKQVDPNAPSHDDIRQLGGLTFIMAKTTHGEIGYSLPGKVSEPPADDIKTLERLAGTFDLAYRRFEDLEKREEQNRETQIELALERVRARTAAMHSSDELKDIALEVYLQMERLGVGDMDSFFFCLFTDDQKEWDSLYAVRDYNSKEEQIKIGIARYPKDVTPGSSEALERFKKGEKNFTIELDEPAIEQMIDGLIAEHEPERAESIRALCLKKMYTNHSSVRNGFLILSTLQPLSEEVWGILNRMGQTFDLAYKRFEDLQKAEDQARLIKEERDRLDAALTDLKATQTQLIQSEKMASLGELTAGIAHEIQNPLNFVNNFSELNDELIQEIKEELEKGDVEEAKTILDDLSENEKKITQHGKRAEGIVKNMLQHSRATSGEKVLTDLNSLCDEYLRLAYHGMRARDKSFQAEFQLDLDPGIPKIEVVPQDIGRVLLNLINNAFQACIDQHRSIALGLVKIKTQLLNQINKDPVGPHIQITISDNGPGIPTKIQDKIFQPFFTTKPTGQGTGLGLSLSYDIVKAHGGEVKFTTRVGMDLSDEALAESGTDFVIIIPIANT